MTATTCRASVASGLSTKVIEKDAQYDHPEGVLPSMQPVDMQGEFNPHEVLVKSSLTRDEAFHEATGEFADVYLLHPLILHSVSRNLPRRPRVILNPPVSLKEPFQLNRPDGRYHQVEMKTLSELGKPDGLGDWKIAGKREPIVPERLKAYEKEKAAKRKNEEKEMKKTEAVRLEN